MPFRKYSKPMEKLQKLINIGLRLFRSVEYSVEGGGDGPSFPPPLASDGPVQPATAVSAMHSFGKSQEYARGYFFLNASAMLFPIRSLKKRLILEPVCCKKQQKIVPDQLLVCGVGDL